MDIWTLDRSDAVTSESHNYLVIGKEILFILMIPIQLILGSEFLVPDAGCWRTYGANSANSRLYSQASLGQKATTWFGTWRPCVSLHSAYFAFQMSPFIMTNWYFELICRVLFSQYWPHHVAGGCDCVRRILQGTCGDCICEIPCFLHTISSIFQRTRGTELLGPLHQKDSIPPSQKDEKTFKMKYCYKLDRTIKNLNVI